MGELQEVKVNNALLQSEPRTDSVTHPGLHGLCKDPEHRKLAICSIICGLSCLGIMSLMYSVKAREARKKYMQDNSPETQKQVQEYSLKACRWGIGSIIAWVILILIFPLLVGLLSFFVTFID